MSTSLTFLPKAIKRGIFKNFYAKKVYVLEFLRLAIKKDAICEQLNFFLKIWGGG